MLEFRCEKCEKIFYSETEFKEHQMMEMLMSFWDESKEVTRKNQEASETRNYLLTCIYTSMNIRCILDIARFNEITYEKAMDKYFKYAKLWDKKWRGSFLDRYKKDKSP